MPTPFEYLREFHEVFDSYSSETPELPPQHIRDLRIRLLKEEWEEYLEGEENDDLVEIADALADMIYIIYGTAVSYGLPMDEIFKEVHASNMSKLKDGKPLFREDGKVLKGPDYFKPRIREILEKQGCAFK